MTLSFAEARQQVLDACTVLRRGESVALLEAHGRFLADDVAAREDIPIADNSGMDGYAVRYRDVATAEQCAARPLRVQEVLAAESAALTPLQPGQAMKIMTGAPVPPGADTVVMVEHTRPEDGRVWILEPPRAAGQHVRQAGADMGRGDVVFHRGDRLLESHVGMLAMLGYTQVPVLARPRVGILATGNEIVTPGAPLQRGKVRDANSYSLHGLVVAAGGEPVLLGIAPDEPAALRAALTQGLAACDVLISSGSVSKGDFDHVKDLVPQLGVTVKFHGINIRPGQPLLFGSKGETLFFGLPGNPVSTMVTFLQLVRPALLKLQGHAHLGLRTLRLPMAQRLTKSDGKRHFLRGRLLLDEQGALAVALTGDQGSQLLHSMGRADCLIVLEERRERVEPGELVQVELLDGAAWEGVGSR
jgi:molybdopterin molybdotransferase